MSLRNFKYLAGFFLLLAVALMATAALAQEQQPSKVDIFAGYAWADTGSHGFDNLSNMPKGFTVARIPGWQQSRLALHFDFRWNT
jgi:opacity protein-like surface antigen